MQLRSLLIAFLIPALCPAVELARPFASHMVLPMDREFPVHGTAAAGERVAVRFGKSIWTTHADRSGAWRVLLPPMPASDLPSELVVTTAGERLVLDDVLVGQVWLCSGQSNMDFPLCRATGGTEEAANAGSRKEIRLFNLTGAPTDNRRYDDAMLARLNVRDHFEGRWERSSVTTASNFSAVAWWAGKLIQEESGVPVGLVENAVGGSGTEAWLPMPVLKSRAAYREILAPAWYDSKKIGSWARGRARWNLGAHTEANHPFRPGFLFESGVRDFADFPFDGVLWYQGETNAEVEDMGWNTRLMIDLVEGWRDALRQKALPFYMVQLPRIGGDDPSRRFWPEYRKAQAEVAAKLDGVTLVITEDLGWDSPDVHPPDKLPVARRLAEAVLHK